MNHTPGPWTLRQSGEANHHTIDNPNTSWLVVIKQNGELSSVTQEFNARLIASAPELLSSLQNLLAPFCLVAEHLPIEQQQDAYNRIQQAKKAIAQATGD